MAEQLKHIESNIGKTITTVTADAGYAHGTNYKLLENRNIDAVIPPQAENSKPGRIPIRRFKYDAKNQVVKCPGGRILTRSTQDVRGWVYRAKSKDCRNCLLRQRCVSRTAASRTVLISSGYESLLRARRRHRKGDKKFVTAYRRHRWRVEGMHGEAKTQNALTLTLRAFMEIEKETYTKYE